MNIIFHEKLNAQLSQEQQNNIQSALQNQSTAFDHPIVLSAYFDAQGLPCPMPLLKAKVALRGVDVSQSLYLLASDKNSQTDLVAFCQKNNLSVHTWQSDIQADKSRHIFHFIITKMA